MKQAVVMKTLLTGIMLAAVTILGTHENSLGDDAKAHKIMELVDARDDGDNMTFDIIMTLIDKKGQKRVRKISAFTKDKGDDSYRLLFFIEPADVKNTAFLTYDYDERDKDDDQWLYLPALKKNKRIATSDKSASFMGSDLNYSDMSTRNIEDYDYYLKKEINDRGHKAWLIQAEPRSKKVINETGYTKSLLIVRQDNYVIARAIHWTKNGYLKYMDVKTLERIEGIWTATEIHITKKRNKQMVHKTIFIRKKVRFNQPLSYDLFSQRRMQKGL